MLSPPDVEWQRKWAQWKMRYHDLPNAWGEFIARLAPWDWWLTITFRDRRRDWQWQANRQGSLLNGQRVSVSFRRVLSGSESFASPPTQDEARHGIWEYFEDLRQQAGKPIQWLVAEEFGKVGGRFHCHGLASGVGHLRRDFWWQEAFRRFGRTQIEPFDPKRGAAFYAAKYASKTLGEIHFGGTLGSEGPSSDLPASGGKARPVAPSAAMERDFYHMSLGRRHK